MRRETSAALANDLLEPKMMRFHPRIGLRSSLWVRRGRNLGIPSRHAGSTSAPDQPLTCSTGAPSSRGNHRHQEMIKFFCLALRLPPHTIRTSRGCHTLFYRTLVAFASSSLLPDLTALLWEGKRCSTALAVRILVLVPLIAYAVNPTRFALYTIYPPHADH